MFDVTIRLVGYNHYGDAVSDWDLKLTIKEAAIDLTMFIPDEASFALVLLDPTAPITRPSLDTVLSIVTIGVLGEEYVPNALAKVFAHRDTGEEFGKLLYTQKHRLSSQTFRYGFSVCLDGTYVGGSGLAEHEDRYLCTLFAAGFNKRIFDCFTQWEAVYPRDDKVPASWWYSECAKSGYRGIANKLCNKVTRDNIEQYKV